MSPHPHVHREAPGVFRIDHAWGGVHGFIASYLVEGDGALALVETGPDTTIGTLLAGIRAAGRDPAELTHVLLTHVHLDHAAAAGRLLQHAPRATVYVHAKGARHLVDPARLLSSAARLYGDDMERLWGTMLPVPADRLRVPADGEPVRVGRRTLSALETPGHATHHLAFHDPDAGLVFTGDVAGIRLDAAPHVRPPTPPPDLDPGAWVASIDRIAALRPERLLLTHFGGVDDVAWHLADLRARLDGWTAWASARIAAGDGPAALADALREKGDAELHAATGDEALVRRYAESIPYDMQAAGLHRHLRQRNGPGDGSRPATEAGDRP
jgi:glyoxylase-like metal-dependent hydrolase (beta-lactamase superfamily II)